MQVVESKYDALERQGPNHTKVLVFTDSPPANLQFLEGQGACHEQLRAGAGCGRSELFAKELTLAALIYFAGMV
jgi:hypothetical protein